MSTPGDSSQLKVEDALSYLERVKKTFEFEPKVNILYPP